jgi:PAS domain S-box-containing protein
MIVQTASLPTPARSPVFLVLAALLATAIFAVDTLVSHGMAIAVLYVIVVLLSVGSLSERGVLTVALGCLGLTVVAYLVQHAPVFWGSPMVRLLVSLFAIVVTTVLVLRNIRTTAELRKQAQLLDLTHDTIFVRDMKNVITYWNRGAEALYGWRSDEALGKVTHELLQSEFPAPVAEITAELIGTGRWEGELVHTARDGRRITVLSRWSLQRNRSGQPAGVLETNNDITERKAAEQNLLRAEGELRATIDTIPALVMRAQPDGTVDFINARWAEEGFSIADLLRDWPALVHPDDLPELMARRQRSLETGDFYEAEARYRRIDGEYRWFLIRGVGLRDETGTVIKRYVTVTDIEERKRAEDALRHSEALLAETQQMTRTGTVGIDVATGELFWSAEGARIFGFDPSTQPQLSAALERVHPDDVGLAQRTIERAFSGEPVGSSDIRLVMPDGSVKHVHALSHTTHDPSRKRVLRAIIDVTAARKAEAALHQSRMELAHVTRVTTLGELTSSIAHEVNQPLAAIVMNGEVCLRLLDRSPMDLAEIHKALDDVIINGKRASEVVARNRALASRAETQKTALDINDVVEEVVPLVRGELQSHRASLRLELEPRLPAVLGDRVQLQQVIINLVVNGMEAMATVTGRERALVVRSESGDADEVSVAVQDSGIGLDPGNEDRLFDAFFTTKADGMGMGLSICRSIIEDHGGRLWASRNPGPGATFHFSLQAHRDSDR